MPVTDYLETIVLGVVQGITEFLPISSDGHLAILGELLRRGTGRQFDPESNFNLTIVLHLGTLFSILAVFRNDLRELPRKKSLCVAIVVATIPVVIVGLLVKDWIEQFGQSPQLAGYCLLANAGLLWVGQRFSRSRHTLDEITPATALVVGVFQVTALLPGVSRSGSTISAGLLRGLKPDAAANFSFLIAVPALAGAVTLMLIDVLRHGSGNVVPGALVVGAAVSFAVGCVALRWLLRIVARGQLLWFAWYCLAVGTATIVWQAVEALQAR